MKPPSPLARIVLGGLSACIIVFGIIAMVVRPMMRGRSTWDATIVGPLAIVVGSLFLVVLALIPGRPAGNSRKSKLRD